MKRFFIFFCILFPVLSCAQPKEDLTERVLELCEYIPDHFLNPGAEDYMTPEFYHALSEAFAAPVADYGEIGDNEWLWYFVTGNGGSTPYYSVKSISRPSKDAATAIINVKDVWDEEKGPEGEGKDYKVSLKRIDGEWLLDDFDGKKKECIQYVKKMRAKYKSGEIVKYLQSDDFTREYVPDFKRRVDDFYERFGK